MLSRNLYRIIVNHDSWHLTLTLRLRRIGNEVQRYLIDLPLLLHALPQEDHMMHKQASEASSSSLSLQLTLKLTLPVHKAFETQAYAPNAMPTIPPPPLGKVLSRLLNPILHPQQYRRLPLIQLAKLIVLEELVRKRLLIALLHCLCEVGEEEVLALLDEGGIEVAVGG